MIAARFLSFVTVGSLLLSLAACSGDEKPGTLQSTDTAVAVTVTTPSGNTTANSITASGQVEAVQTANISTRVMGYITSIPVKVGDAVKAGQLLVSINSTDIQAKRAQTDAMIAQAQAAVESAKKDYDRFTVLYAKQSATAKELDNVTLQYNAAKANLEAAKQMRNEANAQLSYTNITAPFSGIVTQKLMDAGSMATPGMPILTIEQNGSFQVSASVPESQIALLKQGSIADLQIKSTGTTLKGTVAQISQSSQNTGGQYIIKIHIADKDKTGLYAGMYVNVSIPVEKAVTTTVNTNAVLVPLSAIVNKDQLSGVYTVSSNNTAMLRWVRLGNTYGENVEVLSGLAANEKFISSADGKLYNGVPVKIK
ncbi:efflux RND transporter periplasmic adaptor subunit [Panacibacter ginsenosidivorans]|uniref:Efflux RND transporter periplasmic adaptor subunit n=1 Tax=Panacibacter ginsenosidivorans TaxID=1813871 RepID=A0A5B8VEY2_9BACT|nr:efflux RND transporter periplasmic adaptor subunit [Panacibacter ginsenosidivorans]QEC69879.1 efflux RND transporter periplasmic adaptor subunit [Panacibacter ginsenosidivorans]